MPRSLPPLNALKAFEAAARHESMTLAAAELNIAHAAVSRHIRHLEEALRVALFERTGRGVTLTDDGRALAAPLTKAFDLIANATGRYSQATRRRQRLTITSDVAFATHWLAARIGGFAAEHPNVDIVLDPTPRLVNFVKENVDVGIRFGEGAWKAVEAEKLADAEFSLLCHPRLIATSNVRAPRDLPPALLMQEHDWDDLWPAWLTAADAPNVVPSGPHLLHDLTMTSAEAGHGFALADSIVSADALAAGRLIRPFPVTISNYGYFLVRRPGRATSKIETQFRKWLHAEIAKTQATVARLVQQRDAKARNSTVPTRRKTAR